MVERVHGSHCAGPVLRRQDLHERLVESELPAVDEPERGRRGDHLRDRGDPKAGFARDRALVAPVRDTAGVLEHGTAIDPDKSDTTELVRFDSVIEP